MTPAKVTAQNGGRCHALGEGSQYNEDYTDDASSHAEVATVAGKAKDRQKHLSIDAGTRFTCFTRTKVHILTEAVALVN